MRIPYDNRGEEGRLQRLKKFVNEVDTESDRLGENSITSYRSLLEDLLVKYALPYVLLKGSRIDLISAIKNFLPEINFVLNQELSRLDPGWKHILMSKKISDMTGYEYQQYLKLIDK
ncbi:hypothetical protein DYBT9275_03067 [Dyadobacter sp. CECT 9275]|uniref:Uncharacterized protein n=1 Tax=Dyadobacter helix TaxID=2822344 RepID=A0A916NCN7_9BACT|nr:hypothetical protein [Dyadobacter sp. CECT 9275]CAG5003134.1 hypothetical protein DYBT9275_03067 [Dyadobacter sp. CECT 9275]